MSDKRKWPLAEARKVAEQWVERLAPFCQRIAIAGSVRREKPEVGDVEILFAPTMAQGPADLFGHVSSYSRADDALDRMLAGNTLAKRPSAIGVFTWGPENKLGVDVASGIPIDLFSTSLAGWGRSLVIRTGPKDFNIRLITLASRRAIKVHAYGDPAMEKIPGGQPVACDSEKQFLALCGVPWAEPKDRK